MAEASARSWKGMAVRHNCSVNGSERFEWGDSEGSMDVRSEEESEKSLGNGWKEVRSNRGEKWKKRSNVEESDEKREHKMHC